MQTKFNFVLQELEERIMNPNESKTQRDDHIRRWEERNKNHPKGEKERSKRPGSINTTPSKRRSENRLSKSALTPKILDDKNKKSRKNSS
jgi:hypothetical protein